MVYIAEAHAIDEWPISSARHNGARGAVAIAQTTTLGARRAAAAAFVDAFVLRGDGALALAVDDPEAGEPFDAAFAPWPMRFYVLQRDAADAKVYVRFVSAPRDCGEIEIATYMRWELGR